MRLPSALSARVVLTTALLLLAACGSHPDAATDTPGASEAADTKPAALTRINSSSIDLPADEDTFGEGAHADLLNRTCLACHSASMVRYQPPLDRKQWTATVNKMREAYGAPFQASETTAIVDALMAQAPARK